MHLGGKRGNHFDSGASKKVDKLRTCSFVSSIIGTAGRIFCVAFPPSTTLEAAVVLVLCLFVILNRGLRILEHNQ
jgi:hypothetical protein